MSGNDDIIRARFCFSSLDPELKKNVEYYRSVLNPLPYALAPQVWPGEADWPRRTFVTGAPPSENTYKKIKPKMPFQQTGGAQSHLRPCSSVIAFALL